MGSIGLSGVQRSTETVPDPEAQVLGYGGRPPQNYKRAGIRVTERKKGAPFSAVPVVPLGNPRTGMRKWLTGGSVPARTQDPRLLAPSLSPASSAVSDPEADISGEKGRSGPSRQVFPVGINTAGQGPRRSGLPAGTAPTEPPAQATKPGAPKASSTLECHYLASKKPTLH